MLNEGFNYDAGDNLKNTAGTRGSALNDLRTTVANDTPMSASTDSNVGLQFNVKYGAAKLDTVAVQYVADAEYNNAFPTDPT